MKHSDDLLLSLHKTMVRIRSFEKKAEELFLGGALPGFIHLYIGQESIAAGVMANLNREDFITSTHRGHGHMIAKGGDMKSMMAELYGKATGQCKGKGGSMHIADFSIGVFGANGVVGGGLPIATGAGLSIKMRQAKEVAVCFFGDGASNTGAFHESLNFASIYTLPVIFLNENNQFASTAKTSEVTSVDNIADRAAGYNIPGVVIDGQDPIAVYEAAKEAIGRARQGEGPTLIEAKTYRVKGHYVGDPETYKDKDTLNKFMSGDPIVQFEKKLLEERILDENKIRNIWEEAKKEVYEAVKYAQESPLPKPEDALSDLFADDSLYDYY